MKKLKIAVSVMLTLVMAIVCMAVPASAATSSNVKKWALETNIDLKASKSKKSTTYLKFKTEGAGVLSFYFGAEDSKLTKNSKYELLNANKKSLKSGKLSSLATKTFKINKAGTFYLKVTLAKGESIKYFRYYYFAYGAKPTANEEWLKGYSPSADVIAQVGAISSSFIWQTGENDAQFFKEGEINEHQALRWIINPCLGFINVYGYSTDVDSSDSRILTDNNRDKKDLAGYSPYSTNVLPAKAVDDTLYNLFGIKATHKVNEAYTYYYDGYYYYADGGRGNYDEIEYKDIIPTADGRFLLKFLYKEFDFDNGDFDNPKYIESDVYALVSVHQADGKDCLRIHGIYKGEMPQV